LIKRKLTRGPLNHFFGYYGINPWDSTARYHLALQTNFHRRPPGADDEAEVGLVDRESGDFVRYGETRAFNLQQGSMMHWIDAGHGEEFTYNAWGDGRLVSKAVNKDTREERIIAGAIAAVSVDGRQAMGLNYARMYHCRSVVGYANRIESENLPIEPEDDGLYRIDLAGGGPELVLSIAEVIDAAGLPEPPSGRVWFNHVMFNTDGSRLLFFCRIRTARGHRSSLWTVNPDGSELAMQIDFDHWISHFAWFDSRHILVSADLHGNRQFFIFEDGSGRFDTVGEGVLPDDGHACYSPDRRWIVCDTYPRGPDHVSELMLYNVGSGDVTTIGRFASESVFMGDVRCDLHPRWTSDGKTISIDAVPDGDRQIYLLDVSKIVG